MTKYFLIGFVVMSLLSFQFNAMLNSVTKRNVVIMIYVENGDFTKVTDKVN